MDISLHPCQSAQITTIPNEFIDRYMREANGEFVKIYLYLLRHLCTQSVSFSISKLAEDLDHTQRDVKRALIYWEEQHLLRLEYNNMHELSGVFLMDPPKEESEQPSIGSASVLALPVESNPEEIDPKFDELFYMTERLVGHPINDSTVNSILYWHDELGFSIELIEYLVESCAEKKHTNIKYMNQVALNWASEGILTVEEAKNSSCLHSDITYAVLKAFGIKDRTLTKPELDFVNKWTNTYDFSIDIIKEACYRTILKTHKASFEYTDSILKNWFKNNVTSMADIEGLDDKHSKSKTAAIKPISSGNRFNNFTSRDRDYDAIQRKLSSM